MLQWFRVRASYIATLAIAVLAGAGVASGLPHETDCHDGPCGIVQHDASAHRMGAAPQAGADHHHCLVCHLSRTLRVRTETRALVVPNAEPREHVHVEYLSVAVSAPVAQPPLRSPPQFPDFA